jgi:hypothetical protein
MKNKNKKLQQKTKLYTLRMNLTQKAWVNFVKFKSRHMVTMYFYLVIFMHAEKFYIKKKLPI